MKLTTHSVLYSFVAKHHNSFSISEFDFIFNEPTQNLILSLVIALSLFNQPVFIKELSETVCMN